LKDITSLTDTVFPSFKENNKRQRTSSEFLAEAFHTQGNYPLKCKSALNPDLSLFKKSILFTANLTLPDKKKHICGRY
jgi:hypothetical protein